MLQNNSNIKSLIAKLWQNFWSGGISNPLTAIEQISYPLLTSQIQFAQILEKTEALKAQYQSSLQELENLYGSLSQRAFRGGVNLE